MREPTPQPSPPFPQFVPNLTFGPELIAACRKYATTAI